MPVTRNRILICVGLVCLFAAGIPLAAQEPNLTPQEMEDFLLHAKVIASKGASKGITGVVRLTLSDGKITHNAAFQAFDETKAKMEFADGNVEMNFRDTYHYDIAAYELSKMLGLDHMIPVHVARKWEGRTGALSWWVPWKWDEEMRLKIGIKPPDLDAWNRQMHRMRVFTQLVYDIDRNLGNVLITEDWKLYMIDFSRAFRRYNDLLQPKDLEKCDQQLFQKMKELKADEVLARTKPHLSKAEVVPLIQRRDKIVAVFEKLAKEKGESEVFY